MRYGQDPKSIGKFEVKAEEMFFYQYLPIKFPGETEPCFEKRLSCFNALIGVACCDFIADYGLDRYKSSYVYLSAKRLYQSPGCSFNRMGYHADGFMTDDINYIWSDKNPTVFNRSEFWLTMHDSISMKEMEEQALKQNEFCYPDNFLLRLDQFNIHRVAEPTPGIRTFFKLSISKDKYDLSGNSHNHLFDYKWEMKERKLERNIPQSSL